MTGLVQRGTEFLGRLSTRSEVPVLLLACAVAVGSACAAETDETTGPASTERSTSVESVVTDAATTTALPGPADPDLRGELLDMQQRDQAVRAGEAVVDVDGTPLLFDEVDRANQQRLAQIFDEHGWPGRDLVGEDGSTAAWTIVQHADLDLALQQRGLELLTAAVEAGDASPGDLAYLTDRVLVATGEPQEYGTQWTLTEDGRWQPRTAIVDPATVDDRRAEAGLGPLDDYLEELEAAVNS